MTDVDVTDLVEGNDGTSAINMPVTVKVRKPQRSPPTTTGIRCLPVAVHRQPVGADGAHQRTMEDFNGVR